MTDPTDFNLHLIGRGPRPEDTAAYERVNAAFELGSKMTTPQPAGRTTLTARELELLGILQEECAEVIQIVSKIRRFGIDSYSPFDPAASTNQDLLKLELGDIAAVVQLLAELDNPLITESELQDRARDKKIRILKYLRT